MREKARCHAIVDGVRVENVFKTSIEDLKAQRKAYKQFMKRHGYIYKKEIRLNPTKLEYYQNKED